MLSKFSVGSMDFMLKNKGIWNSSNFVLLVVFNIRKQKLSILKKAPIASIISISFKPCRLSQLVLIQRRENA
jgi:hypothetical protein